MRYRAHAEWRRFRQFASHDLGVLGWLTSPNGKTLAFGYQPPGGQHRLVLLPVDGSTPTELPVEVTTGITWMPNGRALLFQRIQRLADSGFR